MKIKILIIMMFALAAVFSLSAARLSLAAPGDCGDPTLQRDANGICLPNNPQAPRSLNAAILRIINFALSVAAVIAIGAVVWGGYLYVLSGVNEKNAEKGRKIVTNAIIGLAIIILSFTIISTVNNSLSCTQIFGFCINF